MADLLASSWAKLDRAKESFDVLKAQLVEATDPKKHPVTFKTEYKAEPRKLTNAQREFGLGCGLPPYLAGSKPERAIIRIASIPAFTIEQSLLLGDALNNCRASLDHLAWTLVKHHKAKLAASKRRTISFPMRQSSKKFIRECENRYLCGVPRNPFLALVETYQPYKRTTTGRTMKALRNLNDTDKHRFVIPVVTPVSGAALTVEFDRCWQVAPSEWQLWPHRALAPRIQALKPNTKLLEALVVRQPHGQVTMKGHLGIYPRLPDTYNPATYEIDQFTAVCAEILSKFEALL